MTDRLDTERRLSCRDGPRGVATAAGRAQRLPNPSIEGLTCSPGREAATRPRPPDAADHACRVPTGRTMISGTRFRWPDGTVRTTALAQMRWCTESAEQDSSAEEREACPPVHLSFQELDLGVGAFDRAVAVGLAQPGDHRGEVLCAGHGRRRAAREDQRLRPRSSTAPARCRGGWSAARRRCARARPGRSRMGRRPAGPADAHRARRLPMRASNHAV